jgi:hypothetical protein
LGDVPSAGNVDVLLLPALESCPFTTEVGGRTKSSIGVVGGRRVLVVGGNSLPDSGVSSPSTYVLRLDTGEVAQVSPDLNHPRIQASVTVFGDGGLIAGGVDRDGVRADAEVYVPAAGGFQQQEQPPIALSQARASHGATVLVTGETLLVGGVGLDGKTVLDTMEIVDPVARTVRAENVATLAVARRSPSVLRLASGEVLVAGGFDATGNAVSKIEWFSPDVSSATKLAQDLVTGSAHAYAALEAGGAIAVIAPPTGAAADFQSVWIVGADGVLTPATPVAGLLGQPFLFGAAGGAPVLFAPAGSGNSGRWLRWQPYGGAFGVLGVDIAANVGDATASPDPGLALWLDPVAGGLAGMRFDPAGEYSTLEGPLLLKDTVNTAPDRLASAGVATFDPAVGLSLSPGASAFVTDRTYADMTVDVDAPTGEPALVVLRDELGNELEVGGRACPQALAPAGPASSLHLARKGASVAWAIAAGASGACAGGVREAARLSVGVRAPASVARSVARNLRIVRLVAP